MSTISRVNARQPTDIDRHIGANLKRIRRQRRLTQVELGEAVGLSFKQIRKYESGENRISAGVLYLAAETLGVDIEDFYAGLPMIHSDGAAPRDSEAVELRRLFLQIRDPRERLSYLRLIKEIGDSGLFR
ncbi:MAG: helix-turn-helix transcriptional regulator [Alphaproteobacteria bacterium]|nr:helix-turn-helix transcriptional regulator [Alphaproteobacteria bacterium]